jgi:hypothetical protein
MMFSPSPFIASPESVGVWLPLFCVSATHRSMFALSREPCPRKVLPHEYAQDAAVWDLLHPRKMFLALSYAFLIMMVIFCSIKGRRCRKHIGSIALMREFADTAPEARYHLWKIGRKLKSRTLFTSRAYAFPGLPHRSLLRSRFPKVTPSRTWFFDAGVHRYRLSYTRQDITQSFLPSSEISRVHIQTECGPGLSLFP